MAWENARLKVDMEIAYPGVAYGGVQGGDGTNTSFVMFNFSSTTRYPGNAAVYIDQTGTISPYVILKQGTGAITGAFDSNHGGQRWGDYANCQERSAGEVWVGGSYGTSAGNTVTYISQIFTPAPVGIEQPVVSTNTPATIFPVPSKGEPLNFVFDVQHEGLYDMFIYDLSGKTIAHPVQDYLREGVAKLMFDTAPLSPGIYIAVVKGEGGSLLEKKFTVIQK